MSHPPVPPPGGGERSAGDQGRDVRSGPDEPTQRLGPANPGQREPTRQFTPTGPWPGAHGGQQPWDRPPGPAGASPYGGAVGPAGPPKRSNTALVVSVVAASLVLVAVLVALVLALQQS